MRFKREALHCRYCNREIPCQDIRNSYWNVKESPYLDKSNVCIFCLAKLSILPEEVETHEKPKGVDWNLFNRKIDYVNPTPEEKLRGTVAYGTIWDNWDPMAIK